MKCLLRVEREEEERDDVFLETVVFFWKVGYYKELKVNDTTLYNSY